MNDHRRIDAGFEQRHTPERVPRPRVNAHHAAVASRRVEHSFAAQPAQIRMRIGIVLGPVAWTGGPDRIAGPLVESVESVGSGPLGAPVGGDAARDHQVPVDQRRGRPAVGKSQPPELLHKRMYPEQFAVSSKRGKNALCALHIHIARFLVHRRTGRGVAQVNRVTKKVIVALVPEFLAGFRVKTGDTFLQVRAIAQVTHDVKFAVGDDRRGLAGKVSGPERVFEGQFLRQVLFERDAGLLRAAPVEPAARRIRVGF